MGSASAISGVCAFEERGEDGLIDRRRGRVSARAADEAEAAWVAEMFRTRYFDFRIKHFHEQIVGMPMVSGKPFRRSYTWTKSVLQFRGLTTKAPRRGSTVASHVGSPYRRFGTVCAMHG